MLEFLGLAFIVVWCLAAFMFVQRRNTQIQLIKMNPVVWVDSAQIRYPSLPLQHYGIPLRIKDNNRLQVIFPQLTESGDVEYIYSWHDFRDIDIPDITYHHKDSKLRALQELAPVIKEQLKIEPEILALEKQYRKIDKLANLVATSDLYSGQLEVYKRALVQIEDAVKKAEQLQQLYIRLVRETLIGVQVAEYNPDSIQTSQLAFDLQYRQIKEEYQTLKDTVHAYSHLLKESKNTEYEQG